MKVTPDNEICFERPLTTEQKKTLTITNDTSEPMAFKIYTTFQPSSIKPSILVRPNMGFLRPNKTIDVSITLGPLPTEPLQSELRKEKFRISHMPVSTKEMGQSPLEFWNGIKETGKEVDFSKLPVRWKQPTPSEALGGGIPPDSTLSISPPKIVFEGTGLNKSSRPIIVRNLTNQDVLLRVKTSNPDAYSCAPPSGVILSPSRAVTVSFEESAVSKVPAQFFLEYAQLPTSHQGLISVNCDALFNDPLVKEIIKTTYLDPARPDDGEASSRTSNPEMERRRILREVSEEDFDTQTLYDGPPSEHHRLSASFPLKPTFNAFDEKQNVQAQHQDTERTQSRFSRLFGWVMGVNPERSSSRR